MKSHLGAIRGSSSKGTEPEDFPSLLKVPFPKAYLSNLAGFRILSFLSKVAIMLKIPENRNMAFFNIRNKRRKRVRKALKKKL